ncbi:hypothetical protein HYT17_01765 [Candidatus Microgenomates bacterium]|nr:hypothetical protein [Candidatus Microgenomates bacterium]MBI2622157.1 hypothetical protein [Candidatus Microgenomates bacterium]
MNIEREIKTLQQEVETIKTRNQRVEADKAWETSLTRNIFIAVVTFILAYVLMLLITESQPLGKALVGSILYLLSTQTYGILKKWWLKKRKI